LLQEQTKKKAHPTIEDNLQDLTLAMNAIQRQNVAPHHLNSNEQMNLRMAIEVGEEVKGDADKLVNHGVLLMDKMDDNKDPKVDRLPTWRKEATDEELGEFPQGNTDDGGDQEPGGGEDAGQQKRRHTYTRTPVIRARMDRELGDLEEIVSWP
jgi:hypothetical protein